MSLDEKSDVQLVREFKSGNPDAFDALVRRFQDRVYRLACVWLYDAELAADATQDVFLRGFKGLKGFRFRSAPFTWIYRTTKNVCNEYNRRRRPQPLEHEPLDDQSDPGGMVAEVQHARRVRELVRKLPARQREVVVLRIFEDLSVRDTAHAMGCREGTVKALLHKATARLKIHLQHAGLRQ